MQCYKSWITSFMFHSEIIYELRKMRWNTRSRLPTRRRIMILKSFWRNLCCREMLAHRSAGKKNKKLTKKFEQSELSLQDSDLQTVNQLQLHLVQLLHPEILHILIVKDASSTAACHIEIRPMQIISQLRTSPACPEQNESWTTWWWSDLPNF